MLILTAPKQKQQKRIPLYDNVYEKCDSCNKAIRYGQITIGKIHINCFDEYVKNDWEFLLCLDPSPEDLEGRFNSYLIK